MGEQTATHEIDHVLHADSLDLFSTSNLFGQGSNPFKIIAELQQKFQLLLAIIIRLLLISWRNSPGLRGVNVLPLNGSANSLQDVIA